MPEAFGLCEHAKKRAERLAELGYVAFAGDPYGNGVEVASLPEAMKLATPLFTDPSKLRKRGRAALDHLVHRYLRPMPDAWQRLVSAWAAPFRWNSLATARHSRGSSAFTADFRHSDRQKLER